MIAVEKKLVHMKKQINKTMTFPEKFKIGIPIVDNKDQVLFIKQ